MKFLLLTIIGSISLSLSALVLPHNTTRLQRPPQTSPSRTNKTLTDFPSNWPSPPYTYPSRPIAIRFREYGRRVTDATLREQVIRDLGAIKEHFYPHFEELRHHTPIERSIGIVTIDFIPSGLVDIAGFEFAQALDLVLELMDDFEWDVIEILRAQMFTMMEPGEVAAEFGIEFRIV